MPIGIFLLNTKSSNLSNVYIIKKSNKINKK